MSADRIILHLRGDTCHLLVGRAVAKAAQWAETANPGDLCAWGYTTNHGEVVQEFTARRNAKSVAIYAGQKVSK